MSVENLQANYTEIDPNNRYLLESVKNTIAGLTRAETAYVYRDFGINFFNANFEHYMTIHCLSASTSGGIAFPWALSNVLNDMVSLRLAGHPALGVYIYRHATGINIAVYESYGISNYSSAYAGAADTTYYLKIKRDEAVGAFGTLYLYIYSDAARTNLLATRSLTLHEKTDYRYLMAGCSFKDSAAGILSGWLDNLSLDGIFSSPGHPYFYRRLITNRQGISA